MYFSLPPLSASSLLVVASITLASASSSKWSSPPTVNLGYETHQGWFNETGQFYNFSNVPYAAPPVGKLRFSAPVAHSIPHGKLPVNDGSRYAVCPQGIPAWTAVTTQWLTEGLGSINISAGYQPPNITSLPTPLYGTSEDCLLLDILVPKAIFDNRSRGEGAPVMLWIHGGGYTLGWKTQYGSGAGLLKASKDGVIYIAINYRLGLFGFLSGPSFQTEGSANAGLLDQRFALEWVQANIHKFGGDPDRVTVIGESAGGGSTIHQITAYGGLKGKVPFQQAIVQSGAFLEVPSQRDQENIFQNFLKLAGVSTVQEARGLSTEKLQLVNAKMVGEAPYGSFTFNPVVDGSFAPALPGDLLMRGAFDQSLKVLIGHNTDEGLLFTSPYVFTPETFKENVITVSFPAADVGGVTEYITDTLYPDVLDGTYGYTNEIARADLIVSESIFSCNANYLARAFAPNGYSYRFSVPPGLHGYDIEYTFYEGPAAAVKNDTLALIMQAYFTNFAKTGDPNGHGLPHFAKYGKVGAGVVQNLNISSIGPVADELENNRCRWWQKALYI
ncbi:acetylcholinesterase precursor [Xylogone sp. PMI_703]|nr:acetylcholinesterase precursor [Xylogone sp. PMI_703]